MAYIRSTFNNTIVTLTDTNGNALSWLPLVAWASVVPGKIHPFAAQMVAEQAAKAAMEHGLRTVEVFVKVLDPAVKLQSVLFKLQVLKLLPLKT